MINEERLTQVLLAPYTSEKSTRIANKYRQIIFKVLKNATKEEIKQAVELLFKVKVNAVCVCNVKGKTKMFRFMAGKRQDWKKAYIALQEGYDINFAGAE